MNTVAAAGWRRLRILGGEPAAVPPILQVSGNEKCGLSVNVDMTRSCTARTPACRTYCYGTRGPISMGHAPATYLRNFVRLRYLERAPTVELEAEADRLAAACGLARQDFLRWNGVGELTAGAVRLIHVLAARHPYLRLWISSRQPRMAAGLPRAPNVHVMLSADRTTKPGVWAAFVAMRQENAGQTFIAWTRLEENDVPPREVDVVFELHKGAWRAPWPPDPRACPATVRGGAAHSAACNACEVCFDLRRRKAHARRAGATR